VRPPLVIALSLASLGGLGVLLESWSWLDSPRRVMRDPTVPQEVLDSGDYGTILRELDLVTTTRPHVDWRWRGKPRERVYTAYTTGEPATESQSLALPYLDEGWPVVSLAIDEGSLHDDVYGLLPNVGVAVEREAHVSIFEGRDLVFTGPVGVRLQGHGERYEKGWAGFRLYLRDEYGAEVLPAEVLPGALMPSLRRLIVRGSSYVNTALSFDISRHIGAIAPAMRPARLVLNGEAQGMFSLTEHLTRARWEERLGHRYFYFSRSRGSNSGKDRRAADELKAWADGLSAGEATIEVVAERVDLDNLSRHLFAIIWCGTSDWAQGAKYFDRVEEEPRWRWVHFDMDRSFGREANLAGPDWESPALDMVLGELPHEPGRSDPESRHYQTTCVRGLLFKKLLRGDPAYGASFVDLATQLMNHRLTPEFFEERLAYYESFFEGARMGSKAFALLREFTENRHAYVRRDLRRVLELEEAVLCSVDGPAGATVLIDGYRETLPYAGWYFPGQELSLAAVPPAGAVTWSVDGGDALAGSCRIPVSRPMTVTASLD